MPKIVAPYRIVKKPHISYIIPNWNRRNLLYECIFSIYTTTKYSSHEIIVIDNASTDDGEEYIKSSFHNVIWIHNTANLGYAKAINQGVELSHGDFIFLLNNDVRLIADAVEKLMSFLGAHSDAGAAAPLLYFPDERIQLSCRRFPTPPALFLEYFGIDKIGPFQRWKLSIKEHLRAGIVQQPMASALMIRRECWDAVGPMDESFPLYFNDVDWCYRLYKNTDYKIYLCPEAKVIHHYGASTNLLGYRKRIEWFRGLLRFYLKHYIGAMKNLSEA